MNFNRKELVDVLEKLEPAIAKKDVLVLAQSFVFRGNTICACNDEIYIQCLLQNDLTGAVKAQEFLGLLAKTSSSDVELEVKDNELKIKTKSSRAGIVFDPELIPPLDIIKPTKDWKRLPEDFLEAVSFCQFTTVNDVTKPFLSMVRVHKNRAMSSDGYRATWRKMGGEIDDELLIRSGIVLELVNHKPIRYFVDDSWVHFANADKDIFSYRLVDCEYPDLAKFFKVTGTPIELKEGLLDIIEKAKLFTKSEFKTDLQVWVKLTDGELIVESNGEHGWFKQRTKIGYKGEPVTFSVQPDFLRDMLAIMTECELAEDRLKISGNGFGHIVCVQRENKE